VREIAWAKPGIRIPCARLRYSLPLEDLVRDDPLPIAPDDADKEPVTQSAPPGPLEPAATDPIESDATKIDSRPLAFRPGTHIADKYVVERLIGEGGLGLVVAARHIHLDQVVAIKSLRPNAMASKGVAERFLREARLAAKIRSEHVVHVYDVGTLPDGAPYMVMEYLAGTDLGRQLNASGPLPVDKAVDYVLQACEALAEAHIAGIVHRDIKPDNLFIATSAGGKSLLKILDFGISKMATRHTTSGNVELTEAGDKFGTPVYMSPEQLLSARDVDARTDVWAIGVVLYELLTGKLPFDGDLPELCTAIINKPPVPLSTARPYLPEALDGVIARCLEKDVAKRFQNVAELAQELRAFAGPVSQVRIDHVVQLIRGAGEAVRPATIPPSPAGRSAREEPTLAETSTERAATTGSGMSAWGAVPGKDSKDGRASRTRLVAFVAATVVAAALALAAITGKPSHPAASVQPPDPAPATSAAPPPPAPEAIPPVAPQPVAAAAPSVVAPATSAAVVPPPPAVRKPRGAGSAKPRTPSTSDPNAVINPFE
jgi:eukaryotic-like serine/threonine-protein kinase